MAFIRTANQPLLLSHNFNMSSQRSSQLSDQAQSGELRPTLPPIREMFGGEQFATYCRRSHLNKLIAELATPVAPPHGRPQGYASNSPRISLSGLSIHDDAPHQYSQSSTATHGQHLHPEYPDYSRSGSPAAHVRNPADAFRPPSHQGYPAYGHAPAITRHIDPNALATSGYPYAVSQPQYPGQLAGPSSGAERSVHDVAAERSTAGRYECTWCGKSFTRPSSLKVGSRLCYVMSTSVLNGADGHRSI